MLIVLDRDGVINEDREDFVKSPDELLCYPGSLKAIALLNAKNIPVVVATNQSGIGRGLYSEKEFERIHHTLQEQLKNVGGHLDGLYYCPHHPDEGCECRKP